jgi:catechol 2,3-dioxygenase-like lactoylglutathione lyase family enzyme
MSMTDSGGHRGRVLRLRQVGLVVSDLAAAVDFYRDALDFELAGTATCDGPVLGTLASDPALSAEAIRMRLGEQELELVCCHPPGRGYPPGSTAADPWFQHFCIPVADMPEAYGRLRSRGDVIPISSNGPELLPPNTGSVTAYKFRDPEGHPLELCFFPPGVGATAWHAPSAGAVFLGIDHSAIAVADSGVSAGFYRNLLGLALTTTTLNRGTEQHRLDGLASEAVEIAALQPADPASAHIELLHYRISGAQWRSPRLRTNDIAATRLVLEAADLPDLVDRLTAAGVELVSKGLVTTDGGTRAILIRDRDGHLLQLQDPQPAREKR